ncbi:aprataxin and PNK-like factor [Lates japonicus]
MSGFDLVPVDGGGPVHLPPGETVLGRGPLLGVIDKRVSRHHGLLENLNGQLRLKPTHLNPCFFQSSLTDDPQPLKKDSWYPLHHGDFFSLLPGQFIYKVVAVGGEESTPSSSQAFEGEEKEEVPSPPEPDVEPDHPVRPDRERTPPHEEPTLANEEEEEGSLNKGDSAPQREVKNYHNDVAKPAIKKRVLPAWMMAAAAPSSLSSSPKVQSTVKRRKTPAAAKQATPTVTSAPEEAELSEEEEEERPRKKRKKDVSSEKPSVRCQSGSNRSEVSDESDNFTVEVEEERKGGETSTADRNSPTGLRSEKKSTNGRQTTKQAESNGSSASKPRLRTPCPYGKDCYRKNPVHFQECSHPGDTDYEEEEEEEEEEADRPECPYGTDCYRKNPLHRKEYKHTKKPGHSTRTVPKKRPDDNEDEDEDLGDDDSFINDDSEDVGDDSDYVPPESDDSGKEDIRRLQEEAKGFLKRRK